jgi:hypothetical protein
VRAERPHGASREGHSHGCPGRDGYLPRGERNFGEAISVVLRPSRSDPFVTSGRAPKMAEPGLPRFTEWLRPAVDGRRGRPHQVRCSQETRRHLAVQDRELIPEHQDLHVLSCLGASQQHQPVDQATSDQIPQTKPHHGDPAIRAPSTRTPRSGALRRVSGTHRARPPTRTFQANSAHTRGERLHPCETYLSI